MIVKFILTTTALFFSLATFAQTKISNEEAFKKINKKKVQLVDVRTTEEYSKKHLKNAMHINWNDQEYFQTSIKKLNKKKPVYVYCLSGGRSNKAAQYLADQGFEVFDIDGGIIKWEASNLPIVNLDNVLSGLSVKDFKALVKSHPVVLVDFYADWCAPCKELAPTIDQIAKQYKDQVKVLKINTDENSNLIKQLGIAGIPKLYVYKNGKETWSKTGISDYDSIQKEIK